VELSAAWAPLDDAAADRVWDRLKTQFDFDPTWSVDGGIREPVPSVTWDLSGELALHGEELDAARGAVNRLVLAALRDCVAPHEWVYALDWQHPCHLFWPHRMDRDEVAQVWWPVVAIPDGDWFIFLAQDLQFGTLGHPVEESLCIFGAELLHAVERHNDGVLSKVLRHNGRSVTT
jgi:hypothetical protein